MNHEKTAQELIDDMGKYLFSIERLDNTAETFQSRQFQCRGIKLISKTVLSVAERIERIALAQQETARQFKRLADIEEARDSERFNEMLRDAHMENRCFDSEAEEAAARIAWIKQNPHEMFPPHNCKEVPNDKD